MSDLTDIANLLKQLRDDTTTLVREEVALAKAEVSEKATTLSRNVAFLAAGGLMAYTALMLLLLGIAYLLRTQFVSGGTAEGTATFLGLLIVGVVVAAVSTVLIVKALTTLKGESLAPRKSIESLKEDKQWVQQKVT